MSASVRSVAAFYDIHGNKPALEAALEEARRAGCDTFVFGGDVASGYMPSETISLLMSLQESPRFVMGNGDRELVAVWDGGNAGLGFFGELTTWAAGRLNKEERDFLASFEPVVEHHVEGVGRVLFCHGTPASDEEIVTVATPDDIVAAALGVTADLVVGGHTHMQFDRRIGQRRFVNAGSVGMPYGGIGAHWLLLGPDVDLRRTTYDLRAAAEVLRATEGPGIEKFIAENLLATPSTAEAIRIFERQAGRG